MNRKTDNRGPDWLLWLGAMLCLSVSTLLLAGKRPPPPKEPWNAPARAGQRKNPIESEAATLAKGKAIYDKMCASCHGKTGHGDGIATSDLDVDPGDLTNAREAGQSDGDLFWKITEGRKPMPKFESKLTEEERWQVIRYLRSLAHASASVPK